MFGPATFGPLCSRAHRAGLICAPSVGPGYDALRATGDTHIRSRDDGATYDAMWKSAIQAGADRVTITSYNEWHEGTQIEPALTPLPRTLAVARGPASSPVAQAYTSYDGAYGLHGRQASRAYLVRTAYWTALYRGSGSAVRASPTGGRAGAEGRKAPSGPESGRVATSTAALSCTASSGSKCSFRAAFGRRPVNLLLGALPSRLMAAVRVTGSDTVVRPPGRAALRSSTAARVRPCYRGRRPPALLEVFAGPGVTALHSCTGSPGGSLSRGTTQYHGGRWKPGDRKGGDGLDEGRDA